MKRFALKLRSLLLVAVCIILASCETTNSSYEAFPMLAVVTEKVNGPQTLKMLDRDGKLTPINLPADNIKYIDASAFGADGAATVRASFYNEKGYRYFIVYRDGSQPKEIQTAENCEIKTCSSFSEGIAIACCWDYAKKEYQLTAFDTKGDSLWTRTTDCNVISPFVDGKAFVCNDKNLLLINKDGNILSNLSMYYNGNYYIEDKWIDRGHRTKETINALRYGLIPVAQRGNGRLQGIIDLQGNFVIEPKYVDISSYDSDRFVVKESGGDYGVVDKGENVIHPFEYYRLMIDGDYVLGGNLRTKEYGWFNNSGELIIPLKGAGFYSNFEYFRYAFDGSDYALCGDNRNGYYVIDKQGNKKFEDKDIRLRFKDNGHEYFIYYQDSSWGEMPVIMNEDGNDVFNPKDLKLVHFKPVLKRDDYTRVIKSEADTWMVL